MKLVLKLEDFPECKCGHGVLLPIEQWISADGYSLVTFLDKWVCSSCDKQVGHSAPESKKKPYPSVEEIEKMTGTQ